VGVLESHLLEDRADPYCGHPETLEIADFAGQPFERATHPVCPGLTPALGLLRGPEGALGVAGLELWSGATPHAPAVIAPIALLIAIGETIQHEKIQHLVFPCGRRGKELPIAELREIHF